MDQTSAPHRAPEDPRRPQFGAHELSVTAVAPPRGSSPAKPPVGRLFRKGLDAAKRRWAIVQPAESEGAAAAANQKMTAAGAACRCRGEEANKAITHTHPALRSSPHPYRRGKGGGGQAQAQAHSHSQSPISLTFLNPLWLLTPPHLLSSLILQSSRTFRGSPYGYLPSQAQTQRGVRVCATYTFNVQLQTAAVVPPDRPHQGNLAPLLAAAVRHLAFSTPKGPGRILPLRGCDHLVFFFFPLSSIGLPAVCSPN